VSETPDHHLWTIVKRRCVPLGQPVPGDPLASRLEPVPHPHKLDLHNLTLAQAHAKTGAFIEAARRRGQREIEIITGRSGQIRTEFATWAIRNPGVRGIEPLNGGGAFRVRLR
jgi:hypothetical protein